MNFEMKTVPDTSNGEDKQQQESESNSTDEAPQHCGMARFLTRYGLGVALIVMVAIIWVGASLWIQRIFGDLDYNKPYFLTYFNTTGFSLWNFGFCLQSWKSVPWDNKEEEEEVIADDCPNSRREEVHPIPTEETELTGEPSSNIPYSRREILRCALIFCPLWFAANALFNASLSTTSVASNTILSSTSCIWALFLSKLLLNQDVVRWHKLVAVGMSVGGSCLIAFSDTSSDGNHSITGDALALLSAFFYGAYTTTIKWLLPTESRYYMGMLFGFVGIINVCFMWPGLLVLDATGLEPFKLPSFEVLWSLVVNALIGTNLSDVMWAKSVVLTSPLVATLGLSLSTPVAMIADAVFNGSTYNAMYISGAISVTVGFIVCSLGS